MAPHALPRAVPSRPSHALPAGAILCLLAICAIWAANAVLLRYAIGLRHLPPVHVAAGRFWVVLVLLFPLLGRPVERRGRVILAGLVMGACHFGFLMLGYQRVSATTSAMILQLAVPATAVLSMLTGVEALSWRRLGLIAAATLCILVALGRPQGMDLAGVGFIALATLALALGSMLLRRTGAVPALVIQAWTALASALALSVLARWIEPQGLAQLAAQPWLSFWSILAPGIVVTIGAHTLYYHLIKRHDPSLISAMTLMFPALTILLGATVLSEPLSLRFVLGTLAAFVLLAWLILARPSLRHAPAPSPAPLPPGARL